MSNPPSDMDSDQPTDLAADQTTPKPTDLAAEQTIPQPTDLVADQATPQPTGLTAHKVKYDKVGNIPRRWRELSGSTNWKNMLEPLDDDLRRYLVHYGERAMATYEAFNYDVWSQNTGTCRYAKEDLFKKTGLVLGNPFKYKATKYIYATSSISDSSSYIYRSLRKDSFMKQTNWIGYVAVSADEAKATLGRRDILVAWRGTVRVVEWFKDADAIFVSPGDDLFKGSSGVMLHHGFKSLYVDANKGTKYSQTSARQQVLSEIKRLLQVYKNEETTITVTGHSLGAALGTINAMDIVASETNRVGSGKTATRVPVTAFVFATPHSGNLFFRDLASKLPVKILRIRNIRDVVPAVPPFGTGYVGVGEELRMDSMLSLYLNNPGTVQTWHDLEIYLHLVAGTQGLSREVKLGNVKRDIALINKYTAGLQAQYLVPPFWKVIANKSMIQQPDGSWKLDDKPHYLYGDDAADTDAVDDDLPHGFVNDEGEPSTA